MKIFRHSLNLTNDYRAQDEALDEFGLEKADFEMGIMRHQQSVELMQSLQRIQVRKRPPVGYLS